MKFWDKHSEEIMKARLLQASAIIYAELGPHGTGSIMAYRVEHAVQAAIALDKQVIKQLRSQGENS